VGNREWIAQHLAKEHPAELPPVVKSDEGIDEIVSKARTGAAHWRATTTGERRHALARIAEVMAANRGRTIAVMAHETGKTVREGDPEVSEAVDFARWAAVSTNTIDELAAEDVLARPLGVVLVPGPWNFPISIPANGVLAALAAGNAVLVKPAPEAVATAAELVRHIHEAGVPPDVVQLVRCLDDDVGRHLVTHPEVDAVTLTGSYETARMFLDWQPSLRLTAETSGKNALVISQTADLDLALRDLVRSAFGHAGQKCSAASLAIVEAPLYDDDTFRRRLADAVRSLRVGPATELASMVGPIIQPAAGKLARGLTELDDTESWLVQPVPVDGDRTARLWRPGIRMGVRPGSWFHNTECFGPVLGVMRADDLDHAVELQNAVEYGLTGGIHTLDDAEIEHWLGRVEVGNAYVNRHTTGAVVRRQPFGGWKRSSVGRGAKSGGPDDILRFTTFGRRTPAAPGGAEASYRKLWQGLFGRSIDRSGLRSESNELRYRRVTRVIVRVGTGTAASDVSSLRAAGTVAGVPVEVSGPPGGRAPVDVIEDDGDLARRVGGTGAERLRLLAPCDDTVRVACHQADIAVDETAVTHHGRVELPCWLREQAISRTLHRHGRVPQH
jgi:RHH-type transcriptional regulator, proline utilization regulon repressor / proline dehydrogenase / delta 1-pyrroline-5-carboxylate dehydrogenase